ncbi:hypothetical protein KPSA3_07742 [Pseudomonas syringae pv. actinidiae]|uniref:Uncharacterized protein n=1 Tax=Pseudomonas syringae pv. actinidiae TaxID=103796 RepID=A0AAN4TQ55_PSESF|nr:hypothetical protein KPSA3_07742 [Pseudomonas syringae pv. actinidiae]
MRRCAVMGSCGSPATSLEIRVSPSTVDSITNLPNSPISMSRKAYTIPSGKGWRVTEMLGGNQKSPPDVSG